MQINSIKLENFRQFYGNQEIKFSSKEKNITIIFGENGKGKTGIFRSLMFGLFGSIYLNQDNNKDKIHLVNFLKVEEEKGRPVNASVEVDFEHKGKRYILKRNVVAYKIGNTIEEQIRNVKLNEIDTDGNFCPDSIKDEREVKEIINNIMDEQIKDFFLFDAERIDTLAKTDTKVKGEVKTIIVKLLQIDKLDTAINILKNLYSKQNSELVKKSSNMDLKKEEKEIETISNRIKDLTEKIDIKKSNIETCIDEIENIEEELSKNEEIRNIQKEIQNLKNNKNDKIQALKYLKDSLRENSFSKCHMITMKDNYMFIQDYLNQIIVDQSDLIPYEVIEKSIENMVCKCCKTDLNTIKEAYENILELKENYKRSELTPLITNINSTIYDFNNEKDAELKNIEEKLKGIRKIKDEINIIEKEINSYKKDMEDFSKNEVNLSNLEVNIKYKKEQLDKLKREEIEMENDISNENSNMDEAQRRFNKLQDEDNSLRVDGKKLKYIKDLRDSLQDIFEEYSYNMRNKLMEETTNIFRILIDKKDKGLIEKIKINEKYEIELYNWLGTKVTQDISQGQRQVVSLAFITALAKIAAGSSENIDFPLFMDTPFGRVSGNNRDNLIENIPKLTSQWILLLTDTEFTTSEEMKIKEVGKLGRWYKLDQIEKGHTQIVEVSLDEKMATRR